MKKLYTLALAATLFTTACGEDKEKDSPAPDAVVEVRWNNVGSVARPQGEPLIIVSTSSVFKTGDAGTVWADDATPGPARVKVGQYSRPKTLFVSFSYVDVTDRDFVAPVAGQYVEGEVFVDGKSRGTLRLDAMDFNNPAQRWGSPVVAAAEEIEIKL